MSTSQVKLSGIMQAIMNGKSIQFHQMKSKDLLTDGKLFKSVYDHALSEKEIEKARVELGETEEKKEKSLRKLKGILLRDGLVSYETEDSYLLRFLRTRKYDIERAYKNVKQYRELKKIFREMFVTGSDMESLLDLKVLTLLPYTDEEGRIIFWMNIKRWNLQEKSAEEILQVMNLVSEFAVVNPKCQINGSIGVWNLEGLTWNHAMEIIKRNRYYSLMKLAENGYPYRIHKLILLNCSPVVRFLYRMACRIVVNKKLVERVVLIGSDMTELHQHVNPAILPQELGGRLDEKECSITEPIMNNLSYIEHIRSFVKI